MKTYKLSMYFIALYFSSYVNAGLIGDSVLLERNFDNFSLGSKTLNVGPGIEEYLFNGWAFNVHDYGLTMYAGNIAYSGTWFNGFIFSDLDFDRPNEVLVGITASGLSQNRVSFTHDSFRLNLGGLAFYMSQQINLTFHTSIISVTEPNSLVLWTLVFALALFRRGRLKGSVASDKI